MTNAEKFLKDEKIIEDEMTSYFYRNVFKAYQELYNYIVDYVDYLEHLLKMNKIPFDRKNIK